MENNPNPRGGCLTAFLIAVMVLNPLVSLSYLLMARRLLQSPFFPFWALPVLVALGLANFIFALGVWKWQRWGVYGFVLSSLVALGVNVSMHLQPVMLVLGLLGPVILILLVRPHWKSMA